MVKKYLLIIGMTFIMSRILYATDNKFANSSAMRVTVTVPKNLNHDQPRNIISGKKNASMHDEMELEN